MPSERQPGIRWGLVLIGILVGIVALWSWLDWYFDPMRQNVQTIRAVADSPPPPPAGKGAPPPPTLPPATREEIALLASGDPGNRLKAADALLGRAPTPDLVHAVDAALARHPDPNLEARLVCLKSRFEGPETLEFLLARFPKERRALDWNLPADVSCVLDALVARATDAPDRIVAALTPAIYASNAGTRQKALRAFRLLDLRQIPVPLIVEASTTGLPNQREALAAVVALGAVRLNPAAVAIGVRDPHTRSAVREELRINPHPNAARIVANVWAERSAESEYGFLARDREQGLHDVSAALLEILGKPSEPEIKRVAAAEHLGTLGEIGALHDLRELSPALETGRLKASIETTIAGLQERQKKGARAQMRSLPQ